MKSILTPLFFVLFTISIHAQFSGYFDPANWVTSHSNGCDDGYVDASGAPGSVTVVGSDNLGCGGSIISYGITVDACGTVSFDWDYTTDDCDGSFYDRFGYYLNGNPVQLSINGYPDGSSQSGSVSIPVAIGDNVAFYIFSTDNFCGRAWSTISNLSAPSCDLEVSLSAPTLYYGYGPLSCGSVTVNTSSSNGPVTYTLTENGVAGDGNVCATNSNCIVVTVTATDAACCVATATITVQVIDARCSTPSGNPKVEICHNGHTICVSANAVPAHLAHGDVLGSCGETANCGGSGLQVEVDPVDPDAANLESAIQNRNSGFTPSVEKLIAMSADQPAIKSIEINPNPANDVVNITVNRGMEGPTAISVYNINGQLMQSSTADISRGVPVELNVSRLNEGNYMIRLESQTGMKLTEKLSITKK